MTQLHLFFTKARHIISGTNNPLSTLIGIIILIQLPWRRNLRLHPSSRFLTEDSKSGGWNSCLIRGSRRCKICTSISGLILSSLITSATYLINSLSILIYLNLINLCFNIQIESSKDHWSWSTVVHRAPYASFRS